MEITTITSIISAVFSLSTLVLIFRLVKHQNEIYKTRIDAAKEKNEITLERLNLVEEEKNRFKTLNEKINKIGASIGIEELKDD